MTPESALAVIIAALAAGTINTVVGSGTLITFPTLLALGYPPVTANVSNNIGLVAGGVSGTWGYRAGLRGQGPLLRLLVPVSVTGAVVGALLLLRLPPGAFSTIVPVLILMALVLVLVQPRLSARATPSADRPDGQGPDTGTRPAQGLPTGSRSLLLRSGVLVAGMYGGYFGAAQGVMLVGLLGALLTENLQRVNAAKNLLASLVNAVSSVTFLLVSPASVDWVVVALLALGSTAGGFLGAIVGRRLPASVLRGVIVTVGLVAVVRLVAQ